MRKSLHKRKRTRSYNSLYDIKKHIKYIDITSIKSTHDRRICYFCGDLLNKSKTKDHIPQRCLYEGTPPYYKYNRWTMYCCERCNTILSKYEESFRDLIGILNSNNHEMLTVTKTAVRNLTSKNNINRVIKIQNSQRVIGVKFEYEILNKNAEKVLKAASFFLFNVDSWNFTFQPIEIPFEKSLITSKWYKSGHEDIFKFRINALNRNKKKEILPSKIKYLLGEFVYWNTFNLRIIAWKKND